MRRDLQLYLSKRDMGYLLDLSFASLNCPDQNNLNAIINNFNKLIPVETILYAHGNIDSMYEDRPSARINDISAPAGYVDMYLENRFHKTDAAIWEFLATLKPASWLKIKCDNYVSYPDSVRAADYGMNDGWSHGVLDITTMDFYIFWLGHSQKDGKKRTEKILEYLIPFITEADKRIHSFQSFSDAVLSPREKEILHWIKEGKGSWEISVILNCSRRVVDFHVTNMKRKLNVTNRPQLVASALSRRLIAF